MFNGMTKDDFLKMPLYFQLLFYLTLWGEGEQALKRFAAFDEIDNES